MGGFASRSEDGSPRLRVNRHSEAQWYACNTRSRAERRAKSMLSDLELETFFPTMYRDRQWADRKKRVEFPLFAGYLFARFELDRLPEVVRVPAVARVVSVNGDGCPTPVRSDEIDAVRTLARVSRETGIEPLLVQHLLPGQPVVVVAGPFRGLRGELIEDRGKTRVTVRLTAIRQAVSVEMDRGSVASHYGARAVAGAGAAK